MRNFYERLFRRHCLLDRRLEPLVLAALTLVSVAVDPGAPISCGRVSGIKKAKKIRPPKAIAAKLKNPMV